MAGEDKSLPPAGQGWMEGFCSKSAAKSGYAQNPLHTLCACVDTSESVPLRAAPAAKGFRLVMYTIHPLGCLQAKTESACRPKPRLPAG